MSSSSAKGNVRSLEVALGNADLAGRVEAFLDCERDYIENSLRPLHELEKRLKIHAAQDKTILNEIEISEVFLDATAIFDFTSGMYDKLNKARWGGIEEFMIQFPIVVDKLIPFFKLYQSFVQKSKKAITRCNELINNNKLFKEFVLLNEAVYAKTMIMLLSSPMNHFPLYLQYFLVISGALHVDDPARPAIEATALKIVDITNYISLSCQHITSREKVVEIQENIFKSGVALLDPSRGLLREGTCKLVGIKSSPDHIFYLFSDFICWVDKGVFSTSIGGMIQIGGIRVTPTVSDASGVKSSFKIKNVITNTEWWIACENDKIRDRWVDDICRAVSEYYSLNEKSNAGIVASTQMLHPDEFEKKIRKKRFDESKQIKKPVPEFPSGFSATGEKIVGPRPPSKPREAPSTPSTRNAPARPPRRPSTSVSIAYTEDSSPTNAHIKIHHAHEPEVEEPYVYDVNVTPEAIGDWMRFVDPSQGRVYYENIVLQITQWDPPQEYLSWRPEKAQRVPPIPEGQPLQQAPVIFFPGPTEPAQQSQPMPPSLPNKPVSPPSMPPSMPTGPPAMPTGPPTMPPSMPPTAPGASPAGRPMNLLSAIRGGAQLKSVSADEDTSPSPSSSSGGGFLSAIQNRPQLRKVSIEKDSKPSPKAQTGNGGGGLNINEALQKSLANYRKFVQDEDDDDDDDEW